MKENLENSDARLVAKACHGDAESFGVLFDKYGEKIYRFIYYKVSSKELAEDFASQVFLKAWEQISGGVKVKTFQAWLYRIARNLVIDYYRSREKEELPLIYPEENIADELKVNPDKNLDTRQLEQILLQIKGDAREIIILRFVEELNIKEIAKIVDKSPANVRVIIHRSLKDLNEYLK